MSSFFEDVRNLFAGQNPSTQRVQIRRRYVSADSGARPSNAIVVKRDPRPYWEEQGWRHQNGAYVGSFQTKFGSWPGHVVVSPAGRVDVFIHNPPAALQRHSHWPCFRPRNDGWFFVHPSTHLTDVSAGILGVEKTITEAYEI